jgi:hypothetical protein
MNEARRHAKYRSTRTPPLRFREVRERASARAGRSWRRVPPLKCDADGPILGAGAGHCVPLFPGARHRRGMVCGRRESNPHEPLQALRIFMPLRLSPPPSRRSWSGLSLHRPEPFRERCCPSSLYTFQAGSVPSGLGSGLPFQGSPTLGSSASPVSRASTQVLLKSVASASSATPAWPIIRCCS